jgi:hypothetical protein
MIYKNIDAPVSHHVTDILSHALAGYDVEKEDFELAVQGIEDLVKNGKPGIVE